MTDKPYSEMSNAELAAEHAKWTENVTKASGWASCYFAARQLEAVVAIGNRRGMALENKFPIVIG